MSKTLHRSLEAKLAALNGPEWDSSDEEIAEPKVAKKASSKKLKKSTEESKSSKQQKREETEDSKVIYLGHLPPAFEEFEILKFLSQFGKVTNIKLSRSERTGNSRGYAFVEFKDNEVAAVVADTMSGYFLMGECRLVCHIVPKDKVHPNLFRGSKRNLARAKAGIMPSENLKILHDKTRKQVNEQKSVQQLDKITKRLLSREKKKRELLNTLGIEYDFPGYRASSGKEKEPPEKKRKPSHDSDEAKDTVSKRQKKLETDEETSSKLVDKKDDVVVETPSKADSVKKSASAIEKKTPRKSAVTDASKTTSTKKAVKAKVSEQTPNKSAVKSTNGDKDGMDVVEHTPKKVTGKRKVTQQESVETPKNKRSAKKAETEVKKKQTSTSKTRRKSVS